ncbi:L10-interacting MYB domain-containing protein-like [Macadamia integrifolia]|uniref:L10-interacting MYB domain-containing protein-like n=1 Tax=Macadamia integrifolia TaxID=60698 RepID=UPI001C50157A|nr:L10-interacting MYB domain-containing protein-like [Macadamia integrifolia]
MSRVMKSPRTPNPKSTTIIWNEAELRAFINHMVENVRKGLKTNSTFTKIGWENICKGLEAEFKRPFGKEQLRNKMNKLQKEYNSFRRLLETTGFGWDANARTATAEDSVWESAIQGNKDWAKYRRNGLTWWLELLEIFSDNRPMEIEGFPSLLLLFLCLLTLLMIMMIFRRWILMTVMVVATHPKYLLLPSGNLTRLLRIVGGRARQGQSRTLLRTSEIF